MTTQDHDTTLHPLRRQIALGIACAAGVLALLTCGLLLHNQHRLQAVNPVDHPLLQELKARYVETPDDDALKDEIRLRDLLLRQEFADRMVFRERGRYLLAGALLLMLLALHIAERFTFPDADLRRPRGDASAASLRTNRRALQLGAFLIACVAVYGIATTPPHVPPARVGTDRAASSRTWLPETLRQKDCPCIRDTQPGAPPPPATIPAGYRPDPDVWNRNWPAFRGPLQNGTAPGAPTPDTGLAEASRLLWTVEVPLSGFGSPIAWEGRVFVTGASSHDTQTLLAYSLSDGQALWQTRIPPVDGSPQARADAGGEAGFAAPTPVTDGKRVVAIFATGDVACLDMDGRILWTKHLGVPENHYGYASSLTLHDGRVIIQWDNAADRKILALELTDGTLAWETPRPGAMSWSSPVVLDAGTGAELLTTAAPYAIAYDPITGAERWRADLLLGEVAPSATTNGTAFFLTMAHCNLTAIRPGGKGNVTDSHVLWQFFDNQPDTSSPLATDSFVLTAHAAGFLNAVDAATGEPLWEEVFNTSFYASPVQIGAHVFLLDNDGILRIFEVEPAYRLVEELHVGSFGGASPAVVDGRLLIRTRTELRCYALTAP